MRRVGLDEHAPRTLAATRASRDLSQQLKGALGGAEVGQVERQVGITTPTSVTPGKSNPLVIICVPTSTSISPRAQALDQHPRIARRPLVSLSIRSIRASASARGQRLR